MKYFVDAQGNYKGGFDQPPEWTSPVGYVEVPTAPVDVRQKWQSGAWTAVDPAWVGSDDQNVLNDVLAAQGSIVRALGLVMFAEINKLRVAGGQTAYTLTQFKAALVAQMRT